MSKKKAVICTILFAIVLISVMACSFSIKIYDGSISLFSLISAFITGRWFADNIEEFYKWLTK